MPCFYCYITYWSFNLLYCKKILLVFVLQKSTWLFINDNTNIRWLKIFHLYKGFHRKNTTLGLFVKGSARVVEPPRMEYKGFKYKYSLKGDIGRSWLIRVNRNVPNSDTTLVRFNANAGIVIKKKNNPKSKFLLGPVTRSIGRKKLLTLFRVVL